MKNKLLAGLLAMLGFSACSPWGDNDDGDGDDVVMYGVLRQSFVVKGIVTDKADEPKPIEGIRVVLRPATEDMYEYFRNDTVWTDKDGKFVTMPRPADLPDYQVTAADVDGEDNGGLFKPDQRTFSFGPPSSDYRYEDGVLLHEVRFELEEDTEIDENE